MNNMNKSELIKAIDNSIDHLTQIDLPTPFVADKSGEQEEITAIFKNEDGNLEVCTWNKDNGGDRDEEVFNCKYPLTGELLTRNDLVEILSQLTEDHDKLIEANSR